MAILYVTNMGDGTIQDMGGYGKVETNNFTNGQVIVMTPDGQMKISVISGRKY